MARYYLFSILSFNGQFRIFDEDEDGHIHASDMVEVLTSLGDRLTKSEARKLVQHAAETSGGDGRIDYNGQTKII